MSSRNTHHAAVVAARQTEGWTITHDPLTMQFGERRVLIDLGAERGTIAAEREGRRIAVEIQSFNSDSPIHDLHAAVGQFVVYRAVLSRNDPERQLYLAVSTRAANAILAEPLGTLMIEATPFRVIVFDVQRERIVRWIE